MKLFHGTNCTIESIDLSLCAPNKDFGQGFYLTDIRQQAEQMALRKFRQTGQGSPTVIEYYFDEHHLKHGELNIRQFKKTSESWARFVLQNRTQPDYHHDYDIVIGPIADDGVAVQLRRYTEHFISLRTLVKELTFRQLNNQYCFCTDKAISKLERI